jgi:hypothetical protein
VLQVNGSDQVPLEVYDSMMVHVVSALTKYGTFQ